MAVKKKAVILRSLNYNDENLELFIGDGNKGEVFVIDLDKQFDWLSMITNNIRNSRKRNV